MTKGYMKSIERALKKGAQVGEKIAQDERKRAERAAPFALPIALFAANTAVFLSALSMWRSKR